MPSTVTLSETIGGSTAHVTVAQGEVIGEVAAESNYNPELPAPPQFGGQVPAVFSIQITIPTGVSPEGILFETGIKTRNLYMGFDGNNDLIFKAWGTANGATGNPERIVYDGSLIARDTTVTLTGEVLSLMNEPNPPPSRVRLWIDHEFVGVGQRSTARGVVWAGFGEGGVDSSAPLFNGEAGNFNNPASDSGVVFDSDLRYWHDTLVGTVKLDRETVIVVQTDSGTHKTLTLDTKPEKVWQVFDGRLRIDWSQSEFYRQVVWDHNRVFDVTTLNTRSAQVVQDENRVLRIH